MGTVLRSGYALPSVRPHRRSLILIVAKVSPRSPPPTKLSTDHPERAVEVLTALVKNLRFERWVYMTQQKAVRQILENALTSGSEQARSFATEAISYLVALGDGGYLDLLAKN